MNEKIKKFKKPLDISFILPIITRLLDIEQGFLILKLSFGFALWLVELVEKSKRRK